MMNILCDDMGENYIYDDRHGHQIRLNSSVSTWTVFNETEPTMFVAMEEDVNKGALINTNALLMMSDNIDFSWIMDDMCDRNNRDMPTNYDPAILSGLNVPNEDAADIVGRISKMISMVYSAAYAIMKTSKMLTKEPTLGKIYAIHNNMDEHILFLKVAELDHSLGLTNIEYDKDFMIWNIRKDGFGRANDTEFANLFQPDFYEIEASDYERISKLCTDSLTKGMEVFLNTVEKGRKAYMAKNRGRNGSIGTVLS